MELEGDEETYQHPTPPADLWFELSPHTGRVHLHAAADGSSPLGESFAPNDVVRVAAAIAAATSAVGRHRRCRLPAAVAVSDAADDEGLSGCGRLQGDAAAILAAAAFVAECHALPPGDRNRLAQGHVPARSPVAETIAAMGVDGSAGLGVVAKARISGAAADAEDTVGADVSVGAGAGAGAVAGGSKTRHGCGRRAPLPAGAEWRPVAVRGGRTGRAVAQRLEPVSAEGGPLCLLCMSPRCPPPPPVPPAHTHGSGREGRGWGGGIGVGRPEGRPSYRPMSPQRAAVAATAGGLLRRAHERHRAQPQPRPPQPSQQHEGPPHHEQQQPQQEPPHQALHQPPPARPPPKP